MTIESAPENFDLNGIQHKESLSRLARPLFLVLFDFAFIFVILFRFVLVNKCYLKV